MSRSGSKKKRKREDLNILSGSTRSRRKGIEIDTENMEQRADSVDYISQLPDHIIHQIIGRLRCNKDTARTCILSKRWRDIWTSFSSLVFDQRKIIGQLSGLKTSSEGQTRIQRNMEIGLIWQNNIKELDLAMPLDLHKGYSLPQCVFAARTITASRVNGCKLGPCNDLNLSNLQKLCLGKLRVNEQMIENMIRACPLLEDFRLIYATGLKVFKVSNLPKLKRIDLHTCSELKEVNLQAPNLETFWYVVVKYRSYKIDLSTCNALKSLTLEDATLKDESFQNHLSCFPALEKLVLTKCNFLKNITISSYKLKTLILRECKQLEEADIISPNLLSFEYKGEKMPFTSLNPSSLKEAKLYFKPSGQGEPRLRNEDNHTPWFARLQGFLDKFDYSRGLKLVVRSDKNIVIYERPKGIFLPQVYDLKLDVVKSSVNLEDLLDYILRTWRPLTLSSLSTSRSRLPKLVCKKLITREKDPSCCTYNASGNKCWRHLLDNVETENLVNGKSKSEWIAWLRSSKSKFKINCFRLSWKHSKHVSQGLKG
ncbi:hypothetical protein Gotri_009973 [Gossypium trilobum]|uniref:F-box domain-containing protein n=1 Tax=Gossypium trilobum TaxID=34281 RepID=A0A7J9EP29_9ROSI|nr:hypothetical protein [Gossypium trilobum]